MFNWAIHLSDKQVLMLMAFASSTPDKHGCQFSAVKDLIGDAWDVRSARKLCEDGLLMVEHLDQKERTPTKSTRWTITKKGNLIAQAINEDADALKQLTIKPVGKSIGAAKNQAHLDWLNKKKPSKK